MAGKLFGFAAGFLVMVATISLGGAASADGYRGQPFSAEAWFATEETLELRYRLYVGSVGYRLEAISPIQGPDIIIAQFAVPQFIYVDTDTGSVNFLPMGDDDWGRFHGIACADFEYRKSLGNGKQEAALRKSGNAWAARAMRRIQRSGGIRNCAIRSAQTSRDISPN